MHYANQKVQKPEEKLVKQGYGYVDICDVWMPA